MKTAQSILTARDKLVSMSEAEQLKLLATDGMPVKRPLLITENTVLAGFKTRMGKLK